MTRAVRRATLAVADAATGGLSMAIGALGAWAGYTCSPGTWSGDWRLAVAGGVAVVAAGAAGGMADLVLTPLRRLLTTARSAGRPTTTRTAPATLAEGLAQAAAATGKDAASRAAADAWGIDQSQGYLRDEDRWRGYEDGTAAVFLAPGVWLHYRSEKTEHGHLKSRFTLLTGDGDQPVPITSVEEIRHQLAARAAGLPATPATDDTENHSDVLDAAPEGRADLDAQPREAVSR